MKDDRLRRLARAGLIADDEYALFIKMMKDMEDEKVLTPKQRMLTVRLFDKLLGLITKDNVVYQKILKKVKEENETTRKRHKEIFESTHTIVEHNKQKFYVGEDEKLIPYNDVAIKKFCEDNGYK